MVWTTYVFGNNWQFIFLVGEVQKDHMKILHLLQKKWYVIFTFSGIKVKNGTYKFTDNDKLSLEKK